MIKKEVEMKHNALTFKLTQIITHTHPQKSVEDSNFSASIHPPVGSHKKLLLQALMKQLYNNIPQKKKRKKNNNSSSLKKKKTC